MAAPVLTDLDQALSELATCETAMLGAPEVVAELERCRNRLEAVVARAAATLDASRAYEADGARSAAAWLAHRCHLPTSEAKAQVRRGRALRELGGLEAASLEGAIGPAQLTLFGRLVGEAATRMAARAHEDLLVDQARSLSFRSFQRALAYFVQLADPDGAEGRAEAQRARRDVTLAQSFEGTYLGRINLDPLAGAIVANELSRLEQASFEADWQEAKERLGREPLAHELARSGAQRRADALVEMARRSAACPGDARFPAPLISVLVDFPTLSGRVCELANGTPVSPGSLLAYLDEAVVERAVWRSPTRVEVSAKARLFSGATRRAIELRDRVCQHPLCELPAERCQVDHVIPFSAGGPTTQANGRLACARHNRLRNHGPDWPTATGGGSRDGPPAAGPAGWD